MDYFELLHKAQMNNKNIGSKETRCYKSSFSAPKKTEKSQVSSANIQRFLARKNEEEKQKQLEAQKKKEELLALRALDKKAQKRVQVMLKRTKSANKSVMEDAIDNYNTKDTLEGPKQCDEDDYGYVSQEASAFYEKLMAKYEKEPVEKVKQMNREEKDLQATKDRVKAALDKEAEELLNPVRKRKRKHDDGEPSLADDDADPDSDTDSIKDKYVKEEEKESKEKPKKIQKKMPPPVDFFELMKIAAVKQHEPIMIEKKVEEPERPMTMKEKIERQKEIDRKNRKANPKETPSKSSAKEDPSARPSSKNNVKVSSERSESSKSKSIIKSKSDLNSNTISPPSGVKKEVKFGPVVEKSSPVSSLSSSKSSSLNGYKNKNSSVDGKLKSTYSNPSKTSSPTTTSKTTIPSSKTATPSSKTAIPPSKTTIPPSKTTIPPSRTIPKGEVETKSASPKVDVSDIDKEIEMLMKKKKMLMEAAKSQVPNQKPIIPKKEPVSNQKSLNKNLPSKPPVNPPMKKTSVDVRNDVPMRGSLAERERPQVKMSKSSEPRPSFASQPQRRPPPSSGPPPRRPAPHLMKKKKRVIDSESEYDSEMDDFIDDDPEEGVDYSRHIKEIFGYDKSRYSNMADEECEESSFRTQMIEERRSARIGLLEDLEDIQREKEEKARAKARKKMKR